MTLAFFPLVEIERKKDIFSHSSVPNFVTSREAVESEKARKK